MIHPKDKTTTMLSALYEGLEAQVVTDYRTTKEMGHLLHHVSTQESIMLLGHGSSFRSWLYWGIALMPSITASAGMTRQRLTLNIPYWVQG